jgi:hypothetical protein
MVITTGAIATRSLEYNARYAAQLLLLQFLFGYYPHTYIHAMSAAAILRCSGQTVELV